MNEELATDIAAYEIFLKFPDNLDYTTQLTVEEQVALQGATELLDVMTPGVRHMCEATVAKCAECNWENIPTNVLYSARIVLASVAPYTEYMREVTRTGHAHKQGGS